LEGLLNLPHTQVLQFMRVKEGRCAHVHIIPLDKGAWVLMFDATAEHERQQVMQQQLNELSIFSYRQSQLLQDLETAREQLVEEKNQLEQVSELKSKFISTLSHELRTPLTSIVGYNLLSLIDNVLDQATLEAGQVVLNPNSCELKQILSDLKSLFFHTAQDKGLVFEINIPVTTPVRVIIDELAFRQVLINLITNAIKFTEKGFVRVTINWQDESQEAMQKIFTAFHRESTAKTLPGAGLGLAISHHLVKLMEGELTVESEIGKGSVIP